MRIHIASVFALPACIASQNATTVERDVAPTTSTTQCIAVELDNDAERIATSIMIDGERIARVGVFMPSAVGASCAVMASRPSIDGVSTMLQLATFAP